jgi:hypothetical protein
MKKLVLLLAFAICGSSVFAQEPVLSFDGDLYFIPGSMTIEGKAFLVSKNNSTNGKFAIYDGDFNAIADFTDPTIGIPYQQRVLTMTRVYDLGSEGSGGGGGGGITRSAGGWTSDEWTVIDDKTSDYTTSSSLSGFELYSDDNTYHSRYLYVSQTLFDDDADFEYVRTRQSIVPIDTKYEDYAKEHSNGYTPHPSISFGGNATIDSLMNATGAYTYEWFWDEESGKRLLKLYKHEQYGGIFNDGIEIATLDGTVKAFLPGITYISSAYYFRGKCYVQGYGSDNSRVLYLLGNNATGIREVSRSKADFSIKREGSNLIFDNETDEQLTLVMSAIDGRIVRSLNAKRGSNQISVSGLMNGIYNVTLYQQSKPIKSSKIIIKN